MSIKDEELKRRRLLATLSSPGPIWRIEDHPELKHGAAAWVSKMRHEEEFARTPRRHTP
jgi:hypothetical protein